MKIDESERHVLIIGAGVIGLTTAVTLAETGYAVTVLTADKSATTTSAAAGALWGPWMVEPRARVLKWAAHSLDLLRELAERPGTGVRIACGLDVSNTDHPPPDWAGLLTDRRTAHPREIPHGYRHATSYSAPLVDMPVHLDYLTRRLHDAGGQIKTGMIDDLHAATSHAPVIINCSGTGASALVPDPALYPVRGDHVVVTNPGLENFLEVDTGDSPDLIAIYPHDDYVILGGTAIAHRWDSAPDPAITDEIIRRCVTVEPRLASAHVVEQRVGHRPTRPTVRLECQNLDGAIVVHNYGHGGAGVSLAWGCARTVAQIVRSERS